MASHIVGYPRMGPKRELKFALESFWDKKSSAEDLKKVSADLRASIWKQMSDVGIKYIPSNTFTYYDHVLDTTATLGAVPPRYGWTGGEIGFDTYFSMARGNATVPAMEMTKWFDTNYHFIVPELGPEVNFVYSSHKAVEEYKEAKALGVDTVPVLVGPVSYLLLSKAAKGVDKSFDLLSLLPKVLAVYKEVIADLKAAGAQFIQFDEPTLVLDLEAHKLQAFTDAYAALTPSFEGLHVLVETYFADIPAEAYKTLTSLSGVAAYGFDLVRGTKTLDLIKAGFPSGKWIFAGVVDGRNIWANDLEASLSTLEALAGIVGKERIVVSTSCSLLHTAVDLVNETKLDDEIKSWLAFAAQKVVEVNALANALAGNKDEAIFSASSAAQASRKSSPRVTNEAVQKAAAALKGSDHRRATNVSARLDAQQKKLNLPILPTTTIGSFPQTVELRRVRREFKAKKISEEEYITLTPQPPLQKLSVISIFSHLRSSSNHLNHQSESGKRAISQCLTSSSATVVDESVRQLCRLVTDGVVDVNFGLLELCSALQGCDLKFVNVFVKGLGFLVRFGFEKRNGDWKFPEVINHPFVMILSSRVEVQSELLQQVLMFMLQNKKLRMVQVCEFLKPLLDFSIIRLLASESSSSSFGLQLVSSMASFCCSCPNESMPVLKLLMGCLKYLPPETSEDYRKLVFVVEHMMEAYIVVLKSLAGEKLLITEAQLCAIEFLGTIMSLLTCLQWHSGGHESIIELSRRLLSVQKDLGLPWKSGLSKTMVSLFTILVQSELEHEQISISKLLLLILKWKYDKVDAIERNTSSPFEEILFLLPFVSLMSSPSKYVKALATDLLLIFEKLLVKMLVAPRHKPFIEEGTHYLSTPGIIVLRLLQHLWYQDGDSSSRISLLNLASKGLNESEIMPDKPRSWASHLRESCLSIVDRRKSTLPLLLSQELFLTETPLLSAVLSVLLIHPSMGASAVDSLSSIAIMDPKLGVPLLLAVMFYSNIFTRNDAICHDMLLKIFEMLPSLASHSAMIPLVVQTILPMLNKDAKVSLYATGTRLLCRTWEINDRAFGSLQGVLLPKGFTDFMSDRAICISLAASIQDVCHKSPDRGVDLILTVSSCIESQDPIIKAFGLQSLSHLCEADVIDFYTAWDVIAKHVQGYKADPIIAHSICLLLKWGAMDAEAYPEASKGVLLILWGLVTSSHGTKWEKAKISALEALVQYEVSQLEKSIPDFKQMNLELFFSETSPTVLKVMEDFHVKIISYEHINRRRLVKGKRVAGSKIEKLVDVFPQAIFSSGKINEAVELPGAALLCFSFTPKNVNEQQASKRPRYVHAAYENALKEIAASLHLSRNILLAFMSLQSWKDFMRRWVKSYIMSYDAKAQLSVLDKTSKAASDILKSMTAIADMAIPRAAENIALAIGALCVVLPPSVHTVKSAASKFLLEWLLQHEHEHRQWSAAISLGLISSCLHVTDHKERYHNITGLLEVLFLSKSSLVKGACGVGLGFLCQDLLTRVEAADDSAVKKETEKVPESELLGKIVGALATTIQQRTKCSSDALDSLCFPLGNDVNTDVFELSSEDSEHSDDLEEDIWGVAGLVFGLATSISALYRAGELETIVKIKNLVISWLPHMNSPFQSTDLQGGKSDIVLALGSCIALPTVVAFCQKMELMDDNEFDHIVFGFKEFISELISVKKSGILHHSLLMASCVGAGTVISCILNEGVHSIEVERVKYLLELFRKCYSNPFPFLVHLGGMLGVVTAMGAGIGILVYMNFSNYSRQSTYQKENSSFVTGPLLSSSVIEPYLTSLVQEMFLVAQNSDNHQLQQFASWVLAFLRHHVWSKQLLGVDGDTNVAETNSKSLPHNFPDDSVVLKLSLWLMEFKYTELGSSVNAGTIVAILGCLSRAPRLPSMDWGAIIRRCMRYEAKVTQSLSTDSDLKKGTLREECVLFAIAHANQFDLLLTFLDELSDLSRLKTLEINLQCCLLNHLADLVKVFSSSRLEKLFGDVGYHLSSLNSCKEYETYEKCLLRLSCWKGLYECLDEVSVDTSGHIFHVERCMEVLFTLLPVVKSSGSVVSGDTSSVEEWSEAVRCLGKAPKGWLSDFLKISQEEFVQSACKSIEVQKKVHAKIKLVKIGSLPPTELGKMKSYILNSKSQGFWDVLLEVAAVLYHAEISFKRQWLIETLEISCVSSFPSAALQFLGLLSATCCKYMPFMIVDQQTVLNDLPVTLVSLLADKNWNVVAETVVSHLFSSTERIYDWTMHIADGSYVQGSQTIDESENHMATFLLQVMHHTCVLLKGYLPLDKQLKLASMVVA